jgi:hypothetical protein
MVSKISILGIRAGAFNRAYADTLSRNPDCRMVLPGWSRFRNGLLVQTDCAHLPMGGALPEVVAARLATACMGPNTHSSASAAAGYHPIRNCRVRSVHTGVAYGYTVLRIHGATMRTRVLRPRSPARARLYLSDPLRVAPRDAHNDCFWALSSVSSYVQVRQLSGAEPTPRLPRR